VPWFDLQAAREQAADLEASYMREAAIRKSEAAIAVRRWAMMRSGLSLVAAHAAAVRITQEMQ
jgi:hypothetical protein